MSLKAQLLWIFQIKRLATDEFISIFGQNKACPRSLFTKLLYRFKTFGERTLSGLFRYQLIMKRIDASHYLLLILVHTMSFQMAIGNVKRIGKNCLRKIIAQQELNVN